MTGLERLQYVATLIKDEKDVMPASYGIYIEHAQIEEEVRGDFDLILEKIEEEYGVITYTGFNDQIIDADGKEHFKSDYSIETLAGYDDFYQQLMKGTPRAPKSSLAGKTLEYDDELAWVRFGDKHVFLPPSTKESFLFRQVYEAKGKPLTTDLLLSEYAFKMHSEEPTERSFKDAYRRVNQKLKEELGIAQAIKYGGEKYWLNPNLKVRDSLHSL